MNKIYILIDGNKRVRCMSTSECNLHKGSFSGNVSDLQKCHVIDRGFTVGDLYNSDTDQWTSKPSNHAQPSEQSVNEEKIKQEIRKIAITNLKTQNELPADYT